MTVVKSKSYTVQSVMFSNWKEKKGRFCPVCDRIYVTPIQTGVSTYYVHTNGLVCEQGNDD